MDSIVHTRRQTHYSIVTKNEPKTLARLAQLLDRERVNVSDIMIATVGKQASIQFVASNDGFLGSKLREYGLRPTETEIVEKVTLCQARQLHSMVKSFAHKKLHVLSLSQPQSGRKARLLLAPERSAPAARRN